MNSYKHLNLEEREALRVGKEKGKSFRGIAKELRRSHTTLSREWERNQMKAGKYEGKYVACRAHDKAEKKCRDQRTKAPLKCPFIFLYVREHLREDWSPETIAGRLSVDHPEYSIHHETIYRYIYSKGVKNRYKLWKHLALGRKKRRVRGGRQVRKHKGKIKGAVSIDLRPEEANQRTSPGHWETDNMEGKKSDKKAVSVTVDRKLLYTLLALLINQKAVSKTKGVVDGLSNYPDFLRQTITFDNGKENSNHKQISEDLNIKSFFCHAYRSWEKGTVENTVGRLRRDIPKGTTLESLTPEQLSKIQDKMNHMPRKKLGWKTPHEAMQEALKQNNCSLTI